MSDVYNVTETKRGSSAGGRSTRSVATTLLSPNLSICAEDRSRIEGAIVPYEQAFSSPIDDDYDSFEDTTLWTQQANSTLSC